tara:strand:+ start:1187 stop:1750 length:564 start_codon:yes stop_codon:yes gene_type:complete
MKILNWNTENATPESKKVLDSGGIIIYPTDTVYGFGVDANNLKAINRLNKIKNRQSPMSIIYYDLDTIKKWTTLLDSQFDIIKKNLLNADTVIIPVKSNIVSEKILGPQNSLGIRMPNHQFCTKLLNFYNKPITTTSVNRHGRKPLKTVAEIEYNFNEIELFIEDGDMGGSPSSIYQFDKNILKKIR